MELSLRRWGSWVSLSAKLQAPNHEVIVEEEEMTEKCSMKNSHGHVIYGTRGGRDISNKWLDEFSSLIYDLIHDRERPYDSADLIQELFNKLPQKKAESLVETLYREYAKETDEDLL